MADDLPKLLEDILVEPWRPQRQREELRWRGVYDYAWAKLERECAELRARIAEMRR